MEKNYKYNPLQYYNNAKQDISSSDYSEAIQEENERLRLQIQSVKDQINEYQNNSEDSFEADLNNTSQVLSPTKNIDNLYEKIEGLRGK